MASQDTEITLGTGKMLGLFFALVAVCALFFGLGYSMGHSAAGGETAKPEQTATAPSGTPASRLETARAASPPVESATKDVDTKAPEAGAQKPAAAAAEQSSSQPAAPDPSAIANPSTYFVQVAAVSKQEDAEALVNALKKKQYPVFATNNTPNDKLYHVQVGPFSDLKEAEDMRAKLIGDGYNPILKR
jgi:cell division septation protein DedD